jgi:hypothetical protein
MIEELLEERDNLFEIASVLYGDMFVTNESFWGSPTELHLKSVYDRLDLFGHQDDEPTDEMIEAAEIIKKMVDKGRNNKN